MDGITAVIVDDEHFNRELLKLLLLRINPGFRIVGEADSALTAGQLIRNTDPDVVFLDIRMPDGNGVDLLRNFPGHNFEVVFVTGNDDYLPKDYHNMVADFVLKPIDIEKLRTTLAIVEKRIAKKRGSANRPGDK